MENLWEGKATAGSVPAALPVRFRAATPLKLLLLLGTAAPFSKDSGAVSVEGQDGHNEHEAGHRIGALGGPPGIAAGAATRGTGLGRADEQARGAGYQRRPNLLVTTRDTTTTAQ